MVSTPNYPKRLIEVDLPIKRISAHARREKSIRHGHISTLHIWWARRPLAACRAVLCASLWLDPADEHCPEAFRQKARELMRKWAKDNLKLLSNDSYQHFIEYQKNPQRLNDNIELRKALLDFIADFADWDNSTVKEYLEISRTLTQTAHEALGGQPGTKPLVVDPFAGGGSIPLEALRVGADAFASDLNPVAVLLNKVVLEYIPKYGQKLADEVRKWGEWIKEEAEKELAEFYPKDPDGSTPIAYLWARTIKCEGPGCGAEVPLMRSLWLAKKDNKSVALRLVPDQKKKRVDFDIIEYKNKKWVSQTDPNVTIEKPIFDGTVKRGSTTCPICGFTTQVKSVRSQLKERQGGIIGAQPYAVVKINPEKGRRFYEIPTKRDFDIATKAAAYLANLKQKHRGVLSLVPDEEICLNEIRRISVPLYGMTRWGDLFTPRQALTLIILINGIHKLPRNKNPELGEAVRALLSLAVDKQADRNCSLCRWISQNENIGYTFGRQALGMVWDYVESPCLVSGGGWSGIVEDIANTIETQTCIEQSGTAIKISAITHPLADDFAKYYFTDPPYYDAVPYSHLSDFFYVWLKRMATKYDLPGFNDFLTQKDEEIVVDRPHKLSTSSKGIEFYESSLTKAFAEGRRIVSPDGLGVIVFASKTTASWEAVLNAVVSAGWIISGSWPIDTEREARIAAIDQARLASSIHLVCRPRENPDGSLVETIGDWRDVLAELPKRIHEWMPRLDKEGIVGADAIFACLGPALEIFSRYSSVEKASGEQVSLRNYLEQVWAAVAREALGMIFEGADASGFEEDARLTAMWLWTLHPGNGNGKTEKVSQDEDSEEQSESEGKKKKTAIGFVLEYDAARKIAQGLGAHLEKLSSIVEIQGDKARLLTVAERTKYLFGKDQSEAPVGRRKKKDRQITFDFAREIEEAEKESGGWGEKNAPKAGTTVLDQLHQAMILFAAGRSEALKRFLVEDGVGKDGRFWRLGQAFSALYPKDSEEKRWVDGVLARKKGLGF